MDTILLSTAAVFVTRVMKMNASITSVDIQKIRNLIS